MPQVATTLSIWQGRVNEDIDKGNIYERSAARQTYAANPRTFYARNVTRHKCNDIVRMVTQIKDAAITIAVVKEAAELEEARDDYPERVESGDELSETAEYN